MRRLLRPDVAAVITIVVLAVFAAAPVSADGKRVALVIGNSAYRNVPALANPPNGAGDLAAALSRLGFAVTLITNASFDEMRRGLIALGRDPAGADMAVVYFAGHGMEITGENWLIPVDAELERDADAANEAISLRSALLQVSNTASIGLIIRAAPPHEGTISAANGGWSMHVVKGLKGCDDGGSYEVRDTTCHYREAGDRLLEEEPAMTRHCGGSCYRCFGSASGACIMAG